MFRAYVVMLVALAVVACDKGTSVNEVTISLTPDSISQVVGQSTTLTATVSPSTQAVTFATRNNGVASVDAAGRVTAVGAGTTFVVATAGSAKDSTKVVVTTPPPTLDLTPDSIAVAVNGTRALSVVLANTSGTATFLSRNTGVATVNAAGVVSGVAVGTTYIKATLGTLNDSTKVIVTASLPAPAVMPLLGTGAVPERCTAEVAAKRNIVYTTTWTGCSGRVGGNVVKVWDASGNTPVLIDSLVTNTFGTSTTTSDVQISPDSAVLAVSLERAGTQNGYVLYSLTDPAHPTLLARNTAASMASGVHTLKYGVVNGRTYLFLNTDPSPVQVVVMDVTTPTAPVQTGVFPMGNPYVHDVFFRDGILFAALWDNGVSVYDVGGGGKGGSPSNFVLMGNIKTAGCPGCPGVEAHNVWWFNDPRTGSKKYAFVGEEGPATIGSVARGDIHVIDVSDFGNMKEVAFFRPDSATSSTGNRAMGVHNFDMDEQSGVLYAAYYNGGVRALDVRGDLSTCTADQKDASGRCNLRLMGREMAMGATSFVSFVWGVKWMGNFLYASDMINGVHKLNVTSLRR